MSEPVVHVYLFLFFVFFFSSPFCVRFPMSNYVKDAICTCIDHFYTRLVHSIVCSIICFSFAVRLERTREILLLVQGVHCVPSIRASVGLVS